MFDWYASLVWVGKLLLAAVLGGAIGFERETHGQSAGLRTNVLVAVGSCLMMLLSVHLESLFAGMDATSVLRVDPGRIASYAVAGMGFLGAGAIIQGKGSVRGLTTAAGLWMVTGVGLSVGAGFLIPAILTTSISLLVLYNVGSLKSYFPHDVYTILSLTCSNTERPLEHIKTILARYPEVSIRFVNYEEAVVSKTVNYRMRLLSKENVHWGRLVGELLAGTPGLQHIKWEEGNVP
jgi:putative Mg2+ transporter-C (MgtC) family protein